MIELVKTIIEAVQSIFTGANPPATILALFVLYLIREIYYGRKRGREKDEKINALHDKIEEYLRLSRGERSDE